MHVNGSESVTLKPRTTIINGKNNKVVDFGERVAAQLEGVLNASLEMAA